MRYVISLFTLSLLLLSVTVSAARQAPARSPWLEFTRLRPGQAAVYCRLELPDTQVQCGETAAGSLAGKRAWSPNGVWSAFVGYQDNEWHLYRRLLYGRKAENLTRYAGMSAVSFPTWSPDGEFLAFAARRGTLRSDIYRMPADGGRLERLTYDYGNEWQPVWSPNNEWIAFVSSPGGGASTLYLMRPDGSHAHAVLSTLQYAERPSWSPDGEWLLFESNCYELTSYVEIGRTAPCLHADFDLYRIHPDGSQLTRLTNSETDDYSAVWSPDGTWIAFTSRSFVGDDDHAPSIFRMRPDGTARQRLTIPANGDLYPVWSPIIDLAWHSATMLLLSICIFVSSIFLYLPRLNEKRP